MDVVLRRRDFYHQMYNCSFYSVDSIPIERRKHVAYGCFLIALFIIFELLYAPCLFAMVQKKLRQYFCYKLMIIMTVFDMLLMPMNVLFPAYANLKGLAYCSFPLLSCFNGITLVAFWIGYATAAMVLALNRCLSYSKYIWIFKGRYELFWLALPFLTTSYVLLFGRFCVYSVISGAWFFNPHVDYYPDPTNKYHPFFHLFANVSFTVFVPAVYFIFFLSNYKLASNREHGMNKSEYSLFFQLLGINITIASAAFSTVVIQYIQLPQFLTTYTHLSWVFVSGTPPFVYLASVLWIYNKSIQRILMGKLGLKRVSPSHAYQQDTQNGTSEERF
ncbi:hypothetical protein M3Y97_01103600 [Aphelenchoides bicaudatus]|nr:hypothetical protein M3Y97_01103600 [Aphelenchoides bicaudatus]